MSPRDALDDLFADAMQAERKHPSTLSRMKNARPEAPKPITTSERYSLPEYWHAGRTLCLVHEETQTVLGTFQEHTHVKERNARRLTRVEGAVAIAGIEYVSGDGWLGIRKEEIAAPQQWETRRLILLPNLSLSAFEVHAEGVEVDVFLRFGGIGRVELSSHTTFHSPDAGVALMLPAGTNVYEVMNLEAKVGLRKEMV